MGFFKTLVEELKGSCDTCKHKENCPYIKEGRGSCFDICSFEPHYEKRKNDIFGGMTYLSKEGQEAYDSILDDFFEDTDIQLFDLNIGGNKMRKLSTIQKREKLNTVYAADEIGPGGANHHYKIALLDANGETIDIKLQCGPRKEEGSQHGVIDSDLLEIVRDRLKAFQTGPFASDYNAKALEHIEEALMWLNRRVEDRIERQVLGTYNK